MKRLCLFTLALVLCNYLTSVPIVQADTTSGGVVIAQVAPNGTTGSQEYVSIYNNTDEDIDITSWCVKYNGSSSKPGCIIPPDDQTKLLLTARSYTTFASNEFMTAHPGFKPQARMPFAAGLSDNGGSLTLVDPGGVIHDSFTWSAKVSAGKVYQRMIDVNGQAFDSGVDIVDFTQATLALPSDEQLGLYEYVLPLDYCGNIEGAQSSVPEELVRDANGDCWEDACPNLNGLQYGVPDGYQLDGEICQLTPKQSARIDITELLPNPASYDTGNEFVELFNPGSEVVSLEGYVLQLGPAFTKTYTFPDIDIAPQSYLAFSDQQTGIVLPNSSASLRLIAPAGNVVSQTNQYEKPREDYAWALLDGLWQLTDIPTRGTTNLPPLADIEDAILQASGLAPCPEGKYRNPDTNRCRNIQSGETSLKPCAADQYRSPETNRCRNLTTLSSGLTPCKPGQERNLDTNRCRAVATASNQLKPCEEGYERNSDTNRCRKVATAKTALPQDPTSTRSTNTVLTTLLLGLTAGYAVYEYRHDIANLSRRLRLRREIKRTS